MNLLPALRKQSSVALVDLPPGGVPTVERAAVASRRMLSNIFGPKLHGGDDLDDRSEA